MKNCGYSPLLPLIPKSSLRRSFWAGFAPSTLRGGARRGGARRGGAEARRRGGAEGRRRARRGQHRWPAAARRGQHRWPAAARRGGRHLLIDRQLHGGDDSPRAELVLLGDHARGHSRHEENKLAAAFGHGFGCAAVVPACGLLECVNTTASRGGCRKVSKSGEWKRNPATLARRISRIQLGGWQKGSGAAGRGGGQQAAGCRSRPPVPSPHMNFGSGFPLGFCSCAGLVEPGLNGEAPVANGRRGRRTRSASGLDPRFVSGTRSLGFSCWRRGRPPRARLPRDAPLGV